MNNPSTTRNAYTNPPERLAGYPEPPTITQVLEYIANSNNKTVNDSRVRTAAYDLELNNAEQYATKHLMLIHYDRDLPNIKQTATENAFSTVKSYRELKEYLGGCIEKSYGKPNATAAQLQEFMQTKITNSHNNVFTFAKSIGISETSLMLDGENDKYLNSMGRTLKLFTATTVSAAFKESFAKEIAEAAVKSREKMLEKPKEAEPRNGSLWHDARELFSPLIQPAASGEASGNYTLAGGYAPSKTGVKTLT